MKLSALALIAVMVAAGCSAATNIPARPEGPVFDQADILPAAVETALDQRLRDLFDNTDDALVIVSVDSLGDEPIEDYARELFNDWSIGDADTDRGLLILVAPNERKVRIEVGCGFESTITNAVAAEIIEQRILPHFRAGDFRGGTLAGVDALIARISLPKPANDPGPHSEICRAQAKEAA